MTTEMATTIRDLKPETVNALQDLVRGLHDSSEFLAEAASRISSAPFPKNQLQSIAEQRQEISDTINRFIISADEQPIESGTWTGNLRTIWTAFRAGLNAGDAKVVLIEAERAEDAILHKFEDVLQDIAGTPINDQLIALYQDVKRGHDLVRELRDQHLQS